MLRNKAHPPSKQQVFAFARLDIWDKLPQAVRDECQRLITQQLKQSIPSQSQQENADEREDSI
jgi:anion-transporting  ArsA/GET3 family ATPase